MTRSDHTGTASGLGLNLRPVFVFLLFLILGPPMGALVLAGGVMLVVAGPNLRIPELAEIGPYIGLVGPFVYLFGGVQAFVVAMAATSATVMKSSGLVPFWPVAIASAVTGLGAILVIAAKASSVRVAALLVVLGVHLGAGIGCWLIANAALWPFHRRERPAGAIR